MSDNEPKSKNALKKERKRLEYLKRKEELKEERKESRKRKRRQKQEINEKRIKQGSSHFMIPFITIQDLILFL
jgi:hypothetical protein